MRRLALLLLVAPVRLVAQLGCAAATCTVEVTMPVSDVVRITTSQASVALGTPAVSAFTAGYLDVSGAATTVTVKSNRAFRVQIVGTTASFSYGGSFANPAKPASDLKWATSQAGLTSTTNTMGTTATLMNTGAAAAATQSLFLRTVWLYSRDVPGTYTLVVALTLSAP